MSTGGFQFAQGNLAKLLALPKYALSAILGWFVPRAKLQWVFGSGIGFGEGALVLARALRKRDSEARIVWLAADESELDSAKAEGFEAVPRDSAAGYWRTLRAGQAIVTHGLGDVNRFGVSGARVIHLGHGAPLKYLHLDAPVTTAVRGPKLLRAILRRMYLYGTGRVDMFVAGSVTAAQRLRSAYRVAPGKVFALGDPRDDALAMQRSDAAAAQVARNTVLKALGLDANDNDTDDANAGQAQLLVLYAPTWRDGAPDPAVPSAEEIVALRPLLEHLDARLLIRSHRLGAGAYAAALGERVHNLGSDLIADITPVLGAFDCVITDYSSIALDYSLLGRPIVWFAPDLEDYVATRGLYEPLEVTSNGRIERSWAEVGERLTAILPQGTERRVAEMHARALGARFHAHPEGGAADRVLDAIERLRLPASELIPEGAIFFESFYGRQISCNPLALDREIASRSPGTPRFWSVIDETQVIPEGATGLLVGGAEWFAARRRARLLIVNDWLRYGFRRRRGQAVLQTWHGTMLKHLALGRPDVGLRTRLAIRRESRRWTLLLAQNPHSTTQFASSYAYRGEVLELGYPRDDRLAEAVVGGARHPIAVDAARRALGVNADNHVLVYAPTWRDGGDTLVDGIDVQSLAAELGDRWCVVARGHTRTQGFGSYADPLGRVLDASAHPDVNDVILAADLLVTDYSSIMFDASVARVPLAFYVPDLAWYRDRERGFTFDFEATAPGPLLTTRAEVVALARELERTEGATSATSEAAEAWCQRFNPHDDGHAAERVVDALFAKALL